MEIPLPKTVKMVPGTVLVHFENQAEDNTQDDALVGSESLHSKEKCSDAGKVLFKGKIHNIGSTLNSY